MGIELELAVLLLLQTFGHSFFQKFEVETPGWRLTLKWLIVFALTLGLYPLLGHWTLAVPLGLAALGTTFHFAYCHKNGIHPLHAEPRRKYYELRGWEWPW